MKSPVIVLLFTLSLATTPVLAQSFDMGSLTPTLDFPEPSPEPVSKDKSGIDK